MSRPGAVTPGLPIQLVQVHAAPQGWAALQRQAAPQRQVGLHPHPVVLSLASIFFGALNIVWLRCLALCLMSGRTAICVCAHLDRRLNGSATIIRERRLAVRTCV